MFLPTNKELLEKNSKFENGAQNLTRDSFTFLSSLGSGSFGKVYKVSSRLTNQIYALKVLSKNQIGNLKLIEQLQNEITILSRCDHENIIKLFAAFEDKAYIFLLMEVANDSTLFFKLRKVKKFTETETANSMNDIIQAIVYLHSQKPIILHRDLKPENILLSNNRCKIADFGWSNTEDDLRNTFCGTPDYLAPEMINGTGHNEKLDIWTLGVLMFELLNGSPPFSPKEKPSDGRMMQKIIEKNILGGVIEFDSSFSIEARQVISAMLNPNGSLRPTARGVLEFDFFRRFGKPLSRNNSESNFNSVKSADSEVAVLRAKIREQETKIEGLIHSNKNLNDLLESKEPLFRHLKNENEDLRNRFLKMKDEISFLTNDNERLMSENVQLKPSQLTSQLTSIEVLNAEIKKYKHEHTKQEETVQYLYKRTKVLSSKVSDFYLKYVLHHELDQTQEFVLSYENTLAKLDAIFEEYIRLKSKNIGVKVSIFGDGEKEPVSNRVFTKSRSPSRARGVPDAEQMKIQNLHKNIFENENSIKTYLSTQSKRIN